MQAQQTSCPSVEIMQGSCSMINQPCHIVTHLGFLHHAQHEQLAGTAAPGPCSSHVLQPVDHACSFMSSGGKLIHEGRLAKQE